MKDRVRSGGQQIKKESPLTEVVGNSPAFKSLLEDVHLVAPADTSVLLLGETGTGKELIANTIHQLSPRHAGPLVKINCAAIPDTLIESILFGHEQGAFTGATQRKRGKFEQAHQGTIFLDEIGEMGPDMQVKFLRVLQEKEVELVGGEDPIKVNCRVIAATNKDLAAEVAEGRFRMDLYYRLTVFPIVLPPLRERPEDIPDLARHFISLYSKKMGRPEPALSASVINDFLRFSWPGNIRELEHIIERAVLLNKGNIITRIELPVSAPKPQRAMVSSSRLEDIERGHIIEVLRKCQGRVAGKGGAAEVLNMNSSTLNSRIKKLGISKSRNVF
jgi:transcriptional regulator with GAF, ATPase, and Fis domain